MGRVVITGQGSINPLGHNVPDTLRAMREGKAGIAELTFPDVDRLSIRIGAAIKDYLPETNFTEKQLALYDRFTQLALVAASEAVNQSGLTFDGKLSEDAAVIVGTAGGGLLTSDAAYREVYAHGKNRVHPFTVPRLMHNAAASQISITHNIQGPVFSVASACASSNHAMGQAFHLVRNGGAKVALTGGVDAMLCFGGIKAWEGLRVLSPDGCRPFSRDRNGMAMGEGAAIFVFEDYDHARRRGADVLCEVAGFSMTSDASDIVLPAQKGAARAMAGALGDATIPLEKVGYINAHGTGTRANDRIETRAIHEVFGAEAANIAVSSTKSMHGHLIGGTGAVELLACIKALREGVIAPTIGYREYDPECDLNLVANEAREQTVEVTLSNAFAFGGLNAVIALKRL